MIQETGEDALSYTYFSVWQLLSAPLEDVHTWINFGLDLVNSLEPSVEEHEEAARNRLRLLLAESL